MFQMSVEQGPHGVWITLTFPHGEIRCGEVDDELVAEVETAFATKNIASQHEVDPNH